MPLKRVQRAIVHTLVQDFMGKWNEKKLKEIWMSTSILAQIVFEIKCSLSNKKQTVKRLSSLHQQVQLRADSLAGAVAKPHHGVQVPGRERSWPQQGRASTCRAAALGMPAHRRINRTSSSQWDTVRSRKQPILIRGHLNALCLFPSVLVVGNTKPGSCQTLYKFPGRLKRECCWPGLYGMSCDMRTCGNQESGSAPCTLLFQPTYGMWLSRNYSLHVLLLTTKCTFWNSLLLTLNSHVTGSCK